MILSEYLKLNKINTIDKIKKFLLNKTFIINGNTNNHNYGSKGTELRIVNVTNANLICISCAKGLHSGNIINYTDLDYLINFNEEIKNLEKEIDRLLNEIKEFKEKQKIMKELKMDVWDEDTYKVYQTLKVLKTKKTDIEKSKIISDLIKK